MSNFIEVTDSRYGDKLLLNMDNVVAIFPSGRVLTNGVHGENTGFLDFAGDDLEKIKAAAISPNQALKQTNQEE